MKQFRALVNSLLCCCILFVLVPLTTVESAGASLFVAPGAPPSGSCTRDQPCDFRYAAEMVASEGDVIYALSGTYTSLDASAVHLLYLHKSLELYGSCYFTATTPVSCDTSLKDSFLDGENNRRVITVMGLGTERVHIEGFTILHGNATAMGSSGCPTFFGSVDGCGGGIYAKNLQNLTLENVTLFHNAGGDNGGLGGGLYAEDINFLAIETATFRKNNAALSGRGVGGGAFILDAGHQNPVIFKENLVDGNETGSEHDDFGAGLFIIESNGVQILNNHFQNNNQANRRLISGSSIFFGSGSNLLIEHNQIEGDWGASAVQLDGREGAVSGFVERNSWFNNSVNNNFEIRGPVTAKVENNFFGFRTPITLSMTRGGASINSYITGDCSNPVRYANVDFLFNTFAAADVGIWVNECANVDVYNNIFTAHQINGIKLETPMTINQNISNNLFHNNVEDADDIGTGAIYGDPKLVNISDGDFHLTEGSAAINRGGATNFDIDIDGDLRPLGSGLTPYDLGADEFVIKFYLPVLMK